MKKINHFIINKDGVISIEFAACCVLLSVLLFIIYDTYNSIMLQNRLERANYTLASIFRERSAIYPIIDDSADDNAINSLCKTDHLACISSHEFFNSSQVKELSQLASLLLDREVAVNIDGLYILQDPYNSADLTRAQLVSVQHRYCPSGICDGEINNYFDSLPSMIDTTDSSLSNYSKLVPYVNRFTSNNIKGRWIPLYRVGLCVVNEESLYLKWINNNRNTDSFLPNLCSHFVVLSRCNDIESQDKPCPVYLRSK